MNKAQKRLVSSLAAASSVAAVLAPATMVFAATDAKALVDEAKKTLAFVDYNAAYAAVVALPEAQQAPLLAELAPLWNKVATSDIMSVLDQMDKMINDKNLKNYYDLKTMIETTVSLERNQQYLLGELTSWGHEMVFTADVTAATDAIIKAWTDKTPESIAAAKEAAAKITNAGSLEWLNNEIASVEATVPVAVSSVTAKTAKTFEVKFNKAVDTTKVTYEVKRLSTAVSVTGTWDATNTVLTLTNSANFPEGSYTVAVKNDTTDLGTSTVAVSAQKVGKIEVTSTKLAVTNTKENNKYVAYATYKVLDQYGTDITTSYLANGLNFQTGVGEVTAKDGTLKILSDNTLIQFAQVVITGYDSTTGVSTSATLATSTAVGTLNGVELKALTNAAGKVLTAGDNTTLFYIDYSATDMSDNDTKAYNLVKGGLILDSNDGLTVSSQYVTARVVQDPTDPKKAAIEVKATNTNISMDLPVSITAMTYTGKTSTLNLTLKKQAALDSFTLMAPSYDIAVNETKEIPFVAYNQNGEQITKYDELNGIVTFSSNNVKLEKNIDGTAKLKVGPYTSSGPQIVTAMTPTGKLSSLTLNIQKAVKANSLELGTKVTNLQVGANQKFDFYDKGGLTVKDQYGRAVDMKTYHNNNYKVIAETSTTTGAALTITPEASAGRYNAGGGTQITVTGANPGTATVVFKLVNTNEDADYLAEKGVANPVVHDGTVAHPYTVIDQKTMTFSVIANSDIKSYALDAVASPIYTSGAVADRGNASAVGRVLEYDANPALWGLTASGAKVLLAGTPIVGVYVDNQTDFTVVATSGAYDVAEVFATKLADNVTSSSTNMTVTFRDVNTNELKSVTTKVTSTSVAPTASSVAVSYNTSFEGLTVDGDVITVSKSKLGTLGFVQGNQMTYFPGDGGFDARSLPVGTISQVFTPATNNEKAKVFMYALDQYGTKAMQLAQITIDRPSGNLPNSATLAAVSASAFDIDANGMITTVNDSLIQAGQYFTLTAVTNNGLVKTVKIVFAN